ncbi:hypothetical protein FJQ98_15960 [Lysinibacillus agricola]|uniref:DNA primase n=1 Tax=Lysinibacillus agricola TaxID=2590012 RepID=A0ABX7ALI1_9BACI|nr:MULTISPECIES: hypothetical protein [Lysinibacillus]KOS61560.1 hypothetical protein AN161_18400 [Lysinibacillus sp. FJAT-14222]QQP10740.1 hypothetical protein FJQ98_15960 [Lysinibacillus agricola]
MDALDLKERIIDDDKVRLILEELGMHSIESNSRYYSCGMPDGDNQNSTIIYRDNLNVDAYTRNIKDAYGNSDIISLVSYVNEAYFSDSLKWICDVCGYDYYEKQKPKSKLATWARDMMRIKNREKESVDEHLEPIDEEILNYYGLYVTDLFKNDGIGYHTQEEFELGYDIESNMIAMPIRDELGNLVGIKGRLNSEVVKPHENKYIYLHPCAKTKILYGLDKAKHNILKQKEVIVLEAEKSVQQLWDKGVKNAVAIGGHKLSKTQVKKLTLLGVRIVIAYDKGVEIGRDGLVDKNFYTNEFDKFMKNQELYCIYDTKGLLKDKESPSDNFDNWNKLYETKRKVRG